MTAQIPPMPVLKDEAPLWPYINALEAHARDLAARLEASNALCAGLAEALERIMGHTSPDAVPGTPPPDPRWIYAIARANLANSREGGE